MSTLIIHNPVGFHDEIIESVIVYRNKIINQDVSISDVCLVRHPSNFNDSLHQYIQIKYPGIRILKNLPVKFDYYINITFYSNQVNHQLKYKNNSKFYYISHVYDKNFIKDNILYVMPHLGEKHIDCDILPFTDQKHIQTKTPVFAVQGNLNHTRRDWRALIDIFEHTRDINYIIKLIGRGTLPEVLRSYRDRIELCNNLNFIDFHRQFLDVFCLLPLIFEDTQPQYFTSKLTSSINYIKGYKTKSIIPKKLAVLYNICDKYSYDNRVEFRESFLRLLSDFVSLEGKAVD